MASMMKHMPRPYAAMARSFQAADSRSIHTTRLSALVQLTQSPPTAASSWLTSSSSSWTGKEIHRPRVGPCDLPSSQVSPPVLQQVRHRSNRSRRGLYDGKDVRSGNNVSFSMKATKRKFKPNVFVKRVYSQVLDAMIPFHLTASTLRSIDKAGGLDEYLLHPKNVITEGEGLAVKRKLLKRIKNQERWARKQHATQLAAGLTTTTTEDASAIATGSANLS